VTNNVRHKRVLVEELFEVEAFEEEAFEEGWRRRGDRDSLGSVDDG
jgi:hypothetical protein